eukprot:1756415-Pyramimonas_sp.AAC.1
MGAVCEGCGLPPVMPALPAPGKGMTLSLSATESYDTVAPSSTMEHTSRMTVSLETTTGMTLSLTKVPERPPQSHSQTAPQRNRTDGSRRTITIPAIVITITMNKT